MRFCYTASQVMSLHDPNAHPHAHKWNREVSNGSAVDHAVNTDAALEA